MSIFLDLKKNETTSFVFKRAQSQSEYLAIYNSRLNICQKDFPYILDLTKEFPAKDKFDDYSILFYVTVDNRVVASCRITPYHDEAWEISSNLPDDINLSLDKDKAVQLNRVYIEDRYRNQNLHAFMFYHFSDWVLQNTPYTVYFAVCKLGLVRLYKNIGASSVIDEGFLLKGRADHKYYLVTGEISSFNKLIKKKVLKTSTLK
ncbi:hypothetical protein [Pedobacter endophyticus]|uniref:N-acetyltransferase domain-containing protein n=1 Tax=Pedobacter endophyticus TaxID=2789740 RepID=A0A7U3Q479_9SPHI|nr:hypothetical protein [Pedobacter endophyticus]QPH38263.1 hypothetical protein IZT61_14320 [Pedobacter endophyticus]